MKEYIWCGFLSFFLSCLFCMILIPILKKMKAGQNILHYVKEHKNKSGTPTMGGIAFVLASVIVSMFFIKNMDRKIVITLVVGISYLLVGCLDDVLKQRHKDNLGLKAWQKLAYQTAIALFVGIFCWRAKLCKLYLPFTMKQIDIGWAIIPFVIFVFLATVNAVNLTDGLDGLAASSCTPFFFVMGVLIVLEGSGRDEATICFAFVGALLAYLLFNIHPANVFMGDTGSLSLGGFIACIATFTGNIFYIAIVGIVFVVSAVSVIMQVVYFKLTKGKRIFLMAPIHHHFQKKGYAENKIAFVYFLITLLLGSLSIIQLL